MGVIVWLKTGFFEKTAYRLEAGTNGLLLVPEKGKGRGESFSAKKTSFPSS